MSAERIILEAEEIEGKRKWEFKKFLKEAGEDPECR